jgi:small subunit ribosomal protein S9
MKSNRLFKVSPASLYATGKRKTATARVWINKGIGNITVNDIDLDIYFNRHYQQSTGEISNNSLFKTKALEALSLTDSIKNFDVMCFVKGGGFTGQVEAIRHAIAKCLKQFNEENRPVLKAAGLLTRDSRKVERKKYGKKKARKSTQFSKR